MRRLFIYGHPGLYGGAGTELHHQIMLWSRIQGMILHIIPSSSGFEHEPLYQSMVNLGVNYEKANDFSSVTEDDAVINFCSKKFLNRLPEIHRQTKRIAWANCMTYLFDKEIEHAKHNYISHYLYQRKSIRLLHKRTLAKNGSTGKFMTFAPHYEQININFQQKDQRFVTLGRISRAATEKYHRNILQIYEFIASPRIKRGIFLGFDENVMRKVGRPQCWIQSYQDHTKLSVEKFYKMVDFIIHPSDTKENLPRVGFEAMNYGVPLVVDKIPGWEALIKHKKNGLLCSSPSEFVYWGSRLAFEPCLRAEIAEGGKKFLQKYTNSGKSEESWSVILNDLFK